MEFIPVPVTIDRNGEGAKAWFEVTAQVPDGRELAANVITDEEFGIERRWVELRRQIQTFIGTRSPLSDAARRALGNILLPPTIRTEVEALLDDGQVGVGGRHGVRLVLLLDEDAELQRAPWEEASFDGHSMARTMRDSKAHPANTQEGEIDYSIVRGHRARGFAPDLAEPERVPLELSLFSALQDEERPGETQFERLLDAQPLGKVVVGDRRYFGQRATVGTFNRELPGTVLHFRSHGAAEGEAEGVGPVVSFGNDEPDQGGAPIGVDGFCEAVTAMTTAKKLAFVEACSTGNAKVHPGFGEALARAGVPIVLSSLVKVDRGAADLFAAELYQYLALGVSIDAAVLYARRKLAGSTDENVRNHWSRFIVDIAWPSRGIRFFVRSVYGPYDRLIDRVSTYVHVSTGPDTYRQIQAHRVGSATQFELSAVGAAGARNPFESLSNECLREGYHIIAACPTGRAIGWQEDDGVHLAYFDHHFGTVITIGLVLSCGPSSRLLAISTRSAVGSNVIDIVLECDGRIERHECEIGNDRASRIVERCNETTNRAVCIGGAVYYVDPRGTLAVMGTDLFGAAAGDVGWILPDAPTEVRDLDAIEVPVGGQRFLLVTTDDAVRLHVGTRRPGQVVRRGRNDKALGAARFVRTARVLPDQLEMIVWTHDGEPSRHDVLALGAR